MTPDRLTLDRVAADAWPAAELQVHHGWLLRATRTASGAPLTKRANSALPLVAGPPTAALLRTVEGFYGDRGLPTLVQVSDPELDEALDALGWESLAPTSVLTGPLPDGDASLVAPAASDAWLQAFSPDDEQRATASDRLRAVTAPAGCAAVEQDGVLVGIGRGVVQEGWLGVFSMSVRPACRRRGVGRALLGALGAWGRDRGATAAYLQVEAGNAPARRLYEQAGFAPAHDYRYRRSPA